MSFYATTVIDKIIPDVYPLWVGADFYTLFIKLFASLGLTDPMFASTALAVISFLETVAFVCFLFSFFNLFNNYDKVSHQWFNRGILLSVVIFSLFSIGDQVFGDRFTLLEHTIFWTILVVSWAIFRYQSIAEERIVRFAFARHGRVGLSVGVLLTLVATVSLFDFSQRTFSNKTKPLEGEEVVDGVYKFDLPFLADKLTMETTLKEFGRRHPDLEIRYIYTGPDELNSKKKTHMLLYLFTERRK